MMTSNDRSLFVRAAAAVGDLGNPFYDEERQRDVWNEAAAVGLQVVIWVGLVAATVAVWVRGAEAVPYALAALLIIGAASWIVIAYAGSLGVDATGSVRLLRARLIPYVAVLGLLLGGITHSGVISSTFGWGLVAGAVAGVAILVVVTVRERRRTM